MKKRLFKIPITSHKMFRNFFNKDRIKHHQSEEEYKEYDRISTKRYRKFQNISVIANIIMVGAFIWFGWCQNNKTQNALDMAIQSASFDSIMRVKDAIKREKNTEIELRAYLAFKDIIISSFKRNSFGWKVSTMNTGKTPTYNTYGVASFQVGVQYLDTLAKFLSNISGIDAEKMMEGNELGDTLFFKFNPSMRITTKQFANIYIGIDTLFIVGVAIYYDVFGARHFTRHCNYTTITDRKTQTQINFSRYKCYNDGN